MRKRDVALLAVLLECFIGGANIGLLENPGKPLPDDWR